MLNREQIMTEPLRRQIKAAQVKLNMDQADYLALLNRITGKSSSTELSKTEIKAVLNEFKRLGWEPNNKNAKLVRTIKFLWMRLGEENCLNTPDRSAMESFCKRFTDGKSLYRAQRGQLQNIVEALKQWCARENISTGRIK